MKFWKLALAACLAAAGAPALRAQSNTAPVLSLAVNDSTNPEVYRGRPWLARVEVFNQELLLNPSGTNTQIIGSATYPWPNAVALQITGPGGTPVSVPLQPANAPSGALVLSAETGGELGWWIAPQHTAVLEAGTYKLQAVLNTSNAPAGWQGIARSAMVELLVTNEPPLLSPEAASERVLGLADYAVWQGDLTAAHALLDGLIASQATNIAALACKGDLLAFSGQDRAALEFYQFALQAYFARYSEPPAGLLRKQKAMLVKVAFMPASPYMPVRAFASAPGQLTLEWPASAGRTYKIESSLDLKHWSVENAGFAAQGAIQTWTTPATGPMRFFRVSEE